MSKKIDDECAATFEALADLLVVVDQRLEANADAVSVDGDEYRAMLNVFRTTIGSAAGFLDCLARFDELFEKAVS